MDVRYRITDYFVIPTLRAEKGVVDCVINCVYY